MKKRRILAVLAAMMTLFLCAGARAEGNWLESVLSGNTPSQEEEGGTVTLLTLEGEISASDYWYDHVGTLEAIEALAEEEENVALLLVLNTPGGGIYEADELYHALLTYKEKTGRPVYAYMAQQCCSAGVLAAMAADTVLAARMTVTGSIGVYTESYSEAGLYEKLGIEHIYIASGENKVSGYPEMTDEQLAIEEAIVAESFGYFKEAIAASRGLTQEQMEPFLDGRVLTASQAKEMGLIDDVLYYDEAVDWILARHEGAALEDVTPGWEEDSYSSGGLFDWLSY